jgi:hypothetical protein
MAQNLRGILIKPSRKQTIHYYLILLDVDDSVNPNLFNNGTQTGSTLEYRYDGELSDAAPTKTIMLPVFVSQAVSGTIPTSVTVTDKTQPNPIVITGDPNKRQPPVFDFTISNNVTPESTINPGLPSTLVIQSNFSVTSGGISTQPFYFVVVMVNTGMNQNSGYTNKISFNTDDTNLLCMLTPSDSLGDTTRAAVGAFPVSLYQYQSVQVVYGTTQNPTANFGQQCSINYPVLI